MRRVYSGKKPFKIFLTVFLVYLFYIAPDYITANTNRYVDLTKSIVEDGTFNIDRYYKNTRDKSFFGGHYYVGAAPGLGLAAVPVYMMARPVFDKLPGHIYRDLEFSILNLVFAFFLAVLPGALLAYLLYDLLKDFDLKEKERVLIVFGASFGTLLFYYSTRFMAHAMATFLLFSAFWILFKSRNTSDKENLRYLLAGCCIGMAVLMDYILLVGSVCMLGYAFAIFRKDRALSYLFLAAGMAISVLAYASYHYACFKNPFMGAFAYGTMYDSKIFELPSLKSIYALTFGSFRGVFTYMPVLLISIYGFFAFFRKPQARFFKEIIFVSIFSLAIFFIIACYDAWDAGGSFGQRYFICLVPFLMIPAAFAFRAMGYRAIFCISALSILINWCGVQYGDADSAFVNIGLFFFMGLNSNLAGWAYKIVNTYIRKLNVITHFSPLFGFCFLVLIVYLIWKDEIDRMAGMYFYDNRERMST